MRIRTLRVLVLLSIGSLVACGQGQYRDGSTGAAPPTGTSSTPSTIATSTPSNVETTAAPPTIEVRTVTETKSIPYATKTVSDPSLAKGTTKVRVAGVPGVKTLTYQVTFTNGVETARKLISEVTTTQPVTKKVAVGTKAPSNCNPNYSGCVPNASDVDCAGGSGDGPAYVQGPIRVIGTDVYKLDADHDGWACETD